MYELSLFSGIGGGLLGSKLLGWRCLGYVEKEKYCQEILKQRIADGILDAAPIFGDIRQFINEGYAESYQGMVDIVTAGFPCQPFSVAGKKRGQGDERNMWPATIQTIRIVRPRYAFLENVPGLLAHKYFGRILSDLAEGGYNAEWCVLAASDVGAPHKRNRLWILAFNPNRIGFNNRSYSHEQNEETDLSNINENLQKNNQSGARFEYRSNTHVTDDVADGIGERMERIIKKKIQKQSELPWGKMLRGIEDLRIRSDIPAPLIRRMDYGMAKTVDRIKAIGNGQVPLSMACAYEKLSQQAVDGAHDL